MAERAVYKALRELERDLEDYIRDADPPIIAEYAHRHGLTGEELRALAEEYPRARKALTRLTEAREIKLEQGGLSGRYKTTMVTFCLKQMGWTGPDGDEEGADGSGVILLGEVEGAE